MKLSFSQLELARKNPAKFGQQHSTGKRFFNNKNFRSYLIGAIKRFHQGMTRGEVMAFFEEKCRANLTLQHYFESRLNHYNQVLAGYCDGYLSQGCQFVETHKLVSLDIGEHSVAGKIERFDLRIPTGYRLTGTQLHETDWQSELRWPLMQKAVAYDFGCSISEVETGIFCLENGQYEYHVFSDTEITEAIDEASEILTKVELEINPP